MHKVGVLESATAIRLGGSEVARINRPTRLTPWRPRRPAADQREITKACAEAQDAACSMSWPIMLFFEPGIVDRAGTTGPGVSHIPRTHEVDQTTNNKSKTAHAATDTTQQSASRSILTEYRHASNHMS